MVFFSALAALALLPSALTAPLVGPLTDADTPKLFARDNTNSFSSWSQGAGTFRCNNGNGGSYSTQWQSGAGESGFVCGKGFQPGGSRYD
jgi:endo-1,4-beta-xylanase